MNESATVEAVRGKILFVLCEMSSSINQKVLLLIETSRSFGRQVIQGVSQFVFENRNWDIIFQDRSVHDPFPEWLKHWDGNGVISRTSDKETYRYLRRLKIPVIELFGDGKRHLPLVRCDEASICQLAADHFWERGFRNFAFFSMGHNWWSDERLQAFRNGLKTYGADCHLSPTAVVDNDITLSVRWWKGCEEEVLRWVRALPKPIAVFCPWDMQAFFFMNICKNHAVLIPEEVAVLGYGNNADLCRVSTPSLSSIAPNAREIGYQAAQLLDKTFRKISLPELPIYVPATHIETRQSTDAVAVEDTEVSAAIRYIRKNIATGSLTVADVADALSISRSNLTRRCVKFLGHSLDEEIVHCRIKYAMELLRETDFTVETIALKLGYSSSTNFIRAFRTNNNLTPMEYRRLNRQES